jgi:hypothetical protein
MLPPGYKWVIMENEVKILIRETDQFYNASKLCQNKGKFMADFMRTECIKKWLFDNPNFIDKSCQQNGHELISGTWMSLCTFPKLHDWVYKPRYKYREREACDVLFNKLPDSNKQKEVRTEYGIIDIITDTNLIEVKIANEFMKAIGQVLTYSVLYPTHCKRIHLFRGNMDFKSYETKCKMCKFVIERNGLDIRVSTEEDMV